MIQWPNPQMFGGNVLSRVVNAWIALTIPSSLMSKVLSAKDWIGLDCSLAMSTFGYSEFGMKSLQLNCECACLNNDRSAGNAIKFSMDLEVILDSNAANVDRDIFFLRIYT